MIMSCSPGLSWRCRLTMDSPMLFRAAVILLLCVRSGASLECHCSGCGGEVQSGHVWNTCLTDGPCYTKVTLDFSGGSRVLRGCLPEEGVVSSCEAADVVCCHSDRCNGQLLGGKGRLRKLLQEETRMTSESMPDISDRERTVAIVTTSVCVVLVAVILSLVAAIAICCFCCGRRGNHWSHAQAEEGQVVVGNCCSAMIPQGVTIASLLSAPPPGPAPSPSLSLLLQRSIVKHTSVERLLERGRFCDWSLGHWRRERVMVKAYSPRQERMWFSETEIHQVALMRHPHLLTFIAADYLHKHGQLQHVLITEYHPRGSLAGYLQEATLDVAAVVVLARSAACGLAHLHLEVRGPPSEEKPSIVHRNVASRSFFVKNDGTCCLGDLSLAVKDGPNFQDDVKGKPLGHAPYLSPEVLDGWGSREPLSCDMWRRADVYALGLVMWEIARRCLIHGCIENAELPFASPDHTPSDHASLEKMQQLVCCKKLRPPLAQHWNQDEAMQSCIQTMTECWQDSPASRPSAMSAKNALDKLSSTIKLRKCSK